MKRLCPLCGEVLALEIVADAILDYWEHRAPLAMLLFAIEEGRNAQIWKCFGSCDDYWIPASEPGQGAVLAPNLR